MANLLKMTAHATINKGVPENRGETMRQQSWLLRVLRSDKIPTIVGVVVGIVMLFQLGIIYFTSFKF